MDNKLQALKRVLGNLQNAGIETRHMFFIKEDIKSTIESPTLVPKISLIKNDNFEVEYNVRTKEIRFSTTHSNQTIDDNFINQMIEVWDMLPLMEEAMNYIFDKENSTHTA